MGLVKIDDRQKLPLMSRVPILQFREVAYLTALPLPCLRYFQEVTGQPCSLGQLLPVGPHTPRGPVKPPSERGQHLVCICEIP